MNNHNKTDDFEEIKSVAHTLNLPGFSVRITRIDGINHGTLKVGGITVPIGPIGNLLSQTKTRRAIINYSKHVPTKVDRITWENCVNNIVKPSSKISKNLE